MRLRNFLPDQSPCSSWYLPLVIGVFPGEGIGAEVIPAALSVLDTLSECTGRPVSIRYGGPIGKDALACYGTSLPDEAIQFCNGIFLEGGAILCGPGGNRFVYELRACFDLYCKFTPLRPISALSDIGVIRPEHLNGVDIVAVRENTGGIYFGEHGLMKNPAGRITAYHHFRYDEEQIVRILRVGLDLAKGRRGRLCVTTKPGGVPSISTLWANCARQMAEGSGIEVRILEIDNAVYQLIANAPEFDVVVSPNMFGDILADCGALLLGSRGLSFSGNFSRAGRAVFQTGHGAAYDIAGTDTANPVGQILSLAMLLREGFDWEDGAAAIETAVAETLAMGYRTPDIASPVSHVLGTRGLTERICAVLAQRLSANLAQTCVPACY